MPATRRSIVRLSLAALTVAGGVLAGLTGCHRPHGALIGYTGGSQTYFSTETQPKSVRLVDVRSGETVFAMDIPPGKQLSLKFVEGGGDDPVYTPDSMLYQVFDLGTETGKLRNAMNVPGRFGRRLDVTLRQGPEYVTPAPDRVLRTDEMEDRPDWWTPKGGELPEDDTGIGIYDG
jgi:hypothetical protein